LSLPAGPPSPCPQGLFHLCYRFRKEANPRFCYLSAQPVNLLNQCSPFGSGPVDCTTRSTDFAGKILPSSSVSLSTHGNPRPDLSGHGVPSPALLPATTPTDGGTGPINRGPSNNLSGQRWPSSSLQSGVLPPSVQPAIPSTEVGTGPTTGGPSTNSSGLGLPSSTVPAGCLTLGHPGPNIGGSGGQAIDLHRHGVPSPFGLPATTATDGGTGHITCGPSTDLDLVDENRCDSDVDEDEEAGRVCVRCGPDAAVHTWRVMSLPILPLTSLPSTARPAPTRCRGAPPRG